jgi:hypothetical protein
MHAYDILQDYARAHKFTQIGDVVNSWISSFIIKYARAIIYLQLKPNFHQLKVPEIENHKE